MRRVDLLINQIRRSTENQDYSETAGIQDDEVIQYLNDAQDEIQLVIQNIFPAQMQTEATITVVGGQEAYDIPSDALLGTRVDNIEYSNDGSVRNYFPLKAGALKERLNGNSGTPSFYIRRSKQILLQPVPSNGGLLRVTYQLANPRLDVRRGTVSAVTLTGLGITTLTLDTAEYLDADSLSNEGYCTIVNKNGVMQMKNIPVVSVNQSTGFVQVEAGFLFTTGETIAVGYYILLGKRSTTHSDLPDICEKYLIEYTNMRILARDSSTDIGDIGQVLVKCEETLKRAFGESDGEPILVPITDASYMGFDEPYR